MLEIRRDDVCLRIDEADGGRAVSWLVGSHDILGSKSPHPIDYGMYPMAPWAGRIRDNAIELHGRSHHFSLNLDPWAIHGLVLSERFSLVEKSDTHVVLECVLGPDWPVGGIVRSSWALDDEGLATELVCSTTSEEFPAVVGWHPWFTRELSGVSATWTTDCSQVLRRGSDALPTGERTSFDSESGPFDDVLTGGTRAEISWPGVMTVEIENSHPWFVVYDAPRNLICIEPQTGPSDGLSGRLEPVTRVTTGQPLVMRTRWRIIREWQRG